MSEPRVLNKRHDFIPPDSVYVGRPSKWGNPFTVEEYGRAECIKLYQAYLDKHPWLKDQAKRELKGKDLVCWCSPQDCHADILMRIANE